MSFPKGICGLSPTTPHIGTAGWSIPRDASAHFPTEGQHLQRYAQALTCAEINATFYRAPMPKTLRRYAETVPPNFRFAVKAPKAITHIQSLSCDPDPLKAFLDLAANLGDKLGPILFQLPPKLAFEEELAESFFDLLRTLHPGPVVCEPRHATWFTPAVSRLLKHHKIARVAADPARVPEAAIPGGWPGLRYYRLHGSPVTYRSPYSADYLAELAPKLTPETWVIFDNTGSNAAIHNALDLQAITQTPATSPKPQASFRANAGRPE